MALLHNWHCEWHCLIVNYATMMVDNVVRARVVGVGWLAWKATESLSAFLVHAFANFQNKSVVFYDCVKTVNLDDLR